MDLPLDGDLVREVFREQLVEADDNRRYLMCVIRQLERNHAKDIEDLERSHQNEISDLMSQIDDLMSNDE